EPSSPARVQLGGSMLSQDVLDSLLVRPGSAERFVRKLLTAEVTHPFADGSFTASLGREEHEQRQVLVPSDDPDGPAAGNLRADTSHSLRLLWTRELSHRTAVDVEFGLGRRRLGGQPDEVQIQQLAASLLYGPGRRTTVFFRLARAEER